MLTSGFNNLENGDKNLFNQVAININITILPRPAHGQYHGLVNWIFHNLLHNLLLLIFKTSFGSFYPKKSPALLLKVNWKYTLTILHQSKDSLYQLQYVKRFKHQTKGYTLQLGDLKWFTAVNKRWEKPQLSNGHYNTFGVSAETLERMKRTWQFNISTHYGLIGRHIV